MSWLTKTGKEGPDAYAEPFGDVAYSQVTKGDNVVFAGPATTTLGQTINPSATLDRALAHLQGDRVNFLKGRDGTYVFQFQVLDGTPGNIEKDKATLVVEAIQKAVKIIAPDFKTPVASAVGSGAMVCIDPVALEQATNRMKRMNPDAIPNVLKLFDIQNLVSQRVKAQRDGGDISR